MFVDLVKINVVSGKGGDGASSFRREKFIPKGGPDGGDGGRGGHVYMEVDRNLTTLVDFHNNRIFKARDGGKGSGSRSHGKNGEDITIRVAAGTIVKDAATGTVIKDLIEHGEKFLLLSGGRGGRGNWHFRTSTRQAPHFYEKGEPGDEKEVTLELKILADVGIIGMANAGKSTLLSKISNAHPKIADYPFTTLTPVLGLVKYSDTFTFVVADIPGLIEGASEGRGLGFDFLRHIERTKLYIHLVDATQGDAYDNFVMINNELKAYNKKLLKRPQVVFVNKAELLSDAEKKQILAKFKKKKIDIDFISAREGEGLNKLLNRVYNVLKDLPPAEEEKPETKQYKEKDTLVIERLDNGVYALHSRRVEKFVSMLDFKTNETVQVFRGYLERQGINKFLKSKGVKTGDYVIIGERDFIFEED
ncbi:MAG: GTPase ObgE [Candidatus Goldiibacteriota bacterium]|jgi:GTP-binding protein